MTFFCRLNTLLQVILLTFLFMSLSEAHAATTLIDFNTRADGTPYTSKTSVNSTEYSSFGVIITRAGTDTILIDPVNPANVDTRIEGFNTGQGPSINFPQAFVNVEFNGTINEVSADFATPNGEVDVLAFDDDDNLILQTRFVGTEIWINTAGFDQLSGLARIQSQDVPIKRVRFQPPLNNGIVLDNLRFGDVLNVDIDIRPGNSQNTVNICSKGVLPVAILSSDMFDASQVDPTTVDLEGATIKFTGKNSEKPLIKIKDANRDGIDDLVVKIDLTELDMLDGETEGTLSGRTFNGSNISGTDSVKVVQHMCKREAEDTFFGD